MKVSLSILLLLFTTFFLQAQTGLIKGKVTDNDNFSVVGAAVYLKSKNVAVVSNEKGEFAFLKVPVGSCQLSRYQSYQLHNRLLFGGKL